MRKITLFILMNLVSLSVMAYSADSVKQADKNKSPLTYQKGGTSVQFYGFVRASTYYDFGGIVDNVDFYPSKIAIPEDWTQRAKYDFDVTATRLGIKYVQQTNSIGDIEMCIETDFRGPNYLRIRHAYISVLGFTVGQTWSNFVDMAAIPSNIDVPSSNGRAFLRVPQIGYSRTFGKFSFGLAAEMPKTLMAASKGIKTINQRIPDFPVYVQYKTKKWHLKLSGLFRGLEYGDAAVEKAKTVFGWGAQLSGSVKIAPFATVYAQGIYGRGIGRYINDLSVLQMDLVPESDTRMRTLPMYGLTAGVKANLTRTLYLSTVFGMAGVSRYDGYYSPSSYYNGTYASGTLFWELYKNLLLAGEYVHGYRRNMDNASAGANRIQLMLQYSF